MIEAVPNFSESHPAVIDSLVQVVQSIPGAYLLDRTSDPDHNRSVLTIAGGIDPVQEAAIQLIGTAAAQIDLRKHQGVHPRMGSCDVMPFVPLEGATIRQCVEVAHSVGQAVWNRYGVPSFFYEEAAMLPERRRLEEVRRGGFENTLLKPDIGDQLHPGAGATIIGARKFLIAYNINLKTEDLSVVQEIAKKIRTSSGGFPCVKALGLELKSRRQVQVSMNLTDFEVTSVDMVFAAVQQEAKNRSVEIAGSELIGLIPRRALPSLNVHWENFDDSMVLENRLVTAMLQPPLNW